MYRVIHRVSSLLGSIGLGERVLVERSWITKHVVGTRHQYKKSRRRTAWGASASASNAWVCIQAIGISRPHLLNSTGFR